MQGRVRKYHSNFYYVEAGGVVYECLLRGLLKKEGTEVLVGDFVTLDNLDEANRTARVVEVLPRLNRISRPKIANVDQVIVVYSLREPDFDPHQLDRYLTHAELAGLPPVVAISKADLAETEDELEEIRELYERQLGYAVVLTSVHHPASLEALRRQARGKVNVLAGPSGAGKSSLLNAINPDFRLRVGDVSERIARGQHTTRHVELLPLEADTYIADTPGFSNLKFNYVLPAEIEDIFRDFNGYREQCEFSDCLHRDEAGCAVREHLGDISHSRYESYLAMLTEAEEYRQEAKTTSQKEELAYKTLDRKGRESLKILRLKEKNRDASRRTQRQQVSMLDREALEEAEGDELADDSPDSV